MSIHAVSRPSRMQGETGTVGSWILYHMAESGERMCNMRRWKSLSGHTGRCRRVTGYLWWEIHRNVTSEEAPSVNHQPWEGTKRQLCCDATPQEVSSRNQLLAWRVPYVVSLWKSHKADGWVWESHKRDAPLGWCSPLWPGLAPHVSQTDPNLVRCHMPYAATHNHSGVTPLSSESQLCDLGYL